MVAVGVGVLTDAEKLEFGSPSATPKTKQKRQDYLETESVALD